MPPPADIARIADAFDAIAARLTDAMEENPRAALGQEAPLEVSIEAMRNLLDLLRDTEQAQAFAATGPAHGLGETDMRVLGDYGIGLCTDLAGWADRLNLPEESLELRQMGLPLACWIARRGGEISNLQPVVDGAAALANALTRPPELERLFHDLTEIVNAVSPAITQDMDRSNPARPWRVLLINRAIVATRSCHPALMDEAFRTLTEHLPEEAPGFFREGMEQMHTLDYPDSVRMLMQRYFDLWCGEGLLH